MVKLVLIPSLITNQFLSFMKTFNRQASHDTRTQMHYLCIIQQLRRNKNKVSYELQDFLVSATIVCNLFIYFLYFIFKPFFLCKLILFNVVDVKQSNRMSFRLPKIKCKFNSTYTVSHILLFGGKYFFQYLFSFSELNRARNHGKN